MVEAERMTTAGAQGPRSPIRGGAEPPGGSAVERLWRSVKYEELYLKDYASVPDLDAGLEAYFRFYNHERPHQSLGYRTPAEVHGA